MGDNKLTHKYGKGNVFKWNFNCNRATIFLAFIFCSFLNNESVHSLLYCFIFQSVHYRFPYSLLLVASEEIIMVFLWLLHNRIKNVWIKQGLIFHMRRYLKQNISFHASLTGCFAFSSSGKMVVLSLLFSSLLQIYWD